MSQILVLTSFYELELLIRSLRVIRTSLNSLRAFLKTSEVVFLNSGGSWKHVPEENNALSHGSPT